MRIFLLAIGAALMLVACRGREVEVISSTTTATSPTPPTTVTPSVTVRLDGDASAVSGVCPSVTFTVSRSIVKTSPTTTVEGGCSAIVNGASVSVTGTRQSDATVAASRITVRESEVEGAIGGITGSCPTLGFTVAGTAVTMNSATVLNGLSCAQLANGTVVRVDGFRRADGSLLASEVSAGRRP